MLQFSRERERTKQKLVQSSRCMIASTSSLSNSLGHHTDIAFACLSQRLLQTKLFFYKLTNIFCYSTHCCTYTAHGAELFMKNWQSLSKSWNSPRLWNAVVQCSVAAASHWTTSSAWWIHSRLPHPDCPSSISTSHFHLRLGLASGVPCGFTTNILPAFLTTHMHACYMFRPCNAPWSDGANKVCWRAQIMELMCLHQGERQSFAAKCINGNVCCCCLFQYQVLKKGEVVLNWTFPKT